MAYAATPGAFLVPFHAAVLVHLCRRTGRARIAHSHGTAFGASHRSGEWTARASTAEEMSTMPSLSLATRIARQEGSGTAGS